MHFRNFKKQTPKAGYGNCQKGKRQKFAVEQDMKAQWFSSLTSAQGKVVATNFFFSEAPGDLTVVSGPKVSGLTYKSRAKWKML